MLSNIFLGSLLAAAASASQFPAFGEIDLIFPRNETYASPGGALPVVFGITKSAYSRYVFPHIKYSIVEVANASHTLMHGEYTPLKADFPDVDTKQPLNNVDVLDQKYFYDYTNSLAGLRGQYRIDIVLQVSSCYRDDKNKVKGPNTNELVDYAFFTLADRGLRPSLDTVSAANTKTTNTTPQACRGQWNSRFAVESWRDDHRRKHDECAILHNGTSSDGYPERACPVTMADATITSIAAGVGNSAAVEASESAASASKAAEKSANAGARSVPGGGVLGMEGLAAIWAVLVFGMSGVMFAAW